MRRRVEDLDAAVRFYEGLTGEIARRFSFGGADLAAVGNFLLFRAGDDVGERLARVAATLAVDDLDAQHKLLIDLGAEVIAAPAQTPNGRRLVARHPDGSVYEYVGP